MQTVDDLSRVAQEMMGEGAAGLSSGTVEADEGEMSVVVLQAMNGSGPDYTSS